MLSFDGHPTAKAEIEKQLLAHYEADEIIKGMYWEGGKGCAIGCILHSSRHEEFEDRFNLPAWLAWLIDTLFEELPFGAAKEFPLQVWRAIPEGVDLEPVKWKFCAFLMHENIDRVLALKISERLKTQVVDAIRGVLAVHETALETGVWDNVAAESAAESARGAARSAWRSAASVESVARRGVWGAAASAESVAESAATSVAYQRYSDELLRLLKEAA